MFEHTFWMLRGVAGMFSSRPREGTPNRHRGLSEAAVAQQHPAFTWQPRRPGRTPFTLSTVFGSALLAVACGSNAGDSTAPAGDLASDVATVTEAIVLEAREVSPLPKSNAPSRREFQRNLMGIWRAKVFQQGAWVDLIWVMGKEHAWHVVTAYADESLSTPLLRWDIVRSYSLGRRSDQFNDGYELAWNDEWSSLLASVDNDGLFAQVGVADCELTPFVLRDTSTDNCGAPLFPFRECTLQDVVELADGRMTFGDPTQGDRCQQRPTRHEAWSFERVAFTAELHSRLFGG